MLKNFENEILLAGRLKSKIDCQKSNIALSVNTVDFWCKQDLIFQTHLNKRVANFFLFLALIHKIAGKHLLKSKNYCTTLYGGENPQIMQSVFQKSAMIVRRT